MEKEILHADMNSCFASIEQARDPSLRNKAMAVCGSTEERNGIVLAKSQEAKLAGVKTGEVIWQAKQKCPDLIIVRPHYSLYMEYAKKAHDIYLQYTYQVEPFGMDECWLDVSGTKKLFGGSDKIAEELRQRFKEELGITLSIGISYNKIFAKLGSDYKKPDAQTRIDRDNYKEVAWSLPVSDLLFVGRQTTKKFMKYGILTIGDLAQADLSFIESLLGINGRKLWIFANGFDTTPVADYDFQAPIKSIGHGNTFRRDLVDNNEVYQCLLSLAQDVTRRLIDSNYSAMAVNVDIRGTDLLHTRAFVNLPYPTQNAAELALYGYKSFLKNWNWKLNIRSLTIRAEKLVVTPKAVQTELFSDYEHHEKHEKVAQAMHSIKERFGKYSVTYASIHNFELADLDKGHSVLPANNFVALNSL